MAAIGSFFTEDLRRGLITFIQALVLLTFSNNEVGASGTTEDSATAQIVVTVMIGPSPSSIPPSTLPEWVIFYGLSTQYSVVSDFDGDGHFDIEEFFAGTDPTDRSSKLKILVTALSGNDAILTWGPTSNGDNISRKYRIFSCNADALGALASRQATIEDMVANPDITDLAEVASQGLTTSYRITDAKEDFPVFYRVFLSESTQF
jgi:hypothetical protein